MDLIDVALLLPEPIDELLFYQRYYVMGFERVASVRLDPLPLALRVVRKPSRQLTALARVHNRIRRLRRLAPPDDAWSVGRYIVSSDRGRTKVAIDAFDSHRVWIPEIVEWSDIYFKSNYWPSAAYDRKVMPIVNGNGSVTHRDLDRARSLRDVEKDIDVTFISNVWGGREHNVRLFEQLAALDCRAELLAVFPGGWADDETRALVARLRSAGVAVSDRPVSRDYLWRTLARSRIVMFRSGVHGCMPWRTVDLLCMGACILLDGVPFPQWPVPLQPGVHYASCGIPRQDSDPADRAEYASVGRTVAGLLGAPREQQRIRLSAAAYYDAHAAPDRVATYVLETVEARG